MNVILIKESIGFYHKYQLYQNDICYSPNKQKEMLQDQSIVIKEKACKLEGNAVSYTKQHPLKEVNFNNIQYAKDQIINIQTFIKNFESHEIEDIRKYIRRGAKRKQKSNLFVNQECLTMCYFHT